MTAKELILKQNFEDIVSYMKANYIPDYEDQDKVGKSYRHGFKKSIEDIRNTTPKKITDGFIIGTKSKEVNTDGTIDEIIDATIIHKKDILEMDTDYIIESFEDCVKHKFPEHYSILFMDWDELLSYEVLFSGFISELELACAILFELTWFGYTKETSERNNNEEINKLEEIARRIESGEEETFYAEEVFKELRDEVFEENSDLEDDYAAQNKAIEKTLEYALEARREELKFLREVQSKCQREEESVN